MIGGVMSRDLERRSALVTGGAKGIGAAIAIELCRRGARVVIADLDVDAATAVAAEIGAAALLLDVTDSSAVASAVNSHGPFDILVNNAGLDQHAFFTETTPADWRRLLAINLEAVFACTHAVLPAMQRARRGRIINVASEAGRSGTTEWL